MGEVAEEAEDVEVDAHAGRFVKVIDRSGWEVCWLEVEGRVVVPGLSHGELLLLLLVS